jgi:hypothetical protein
MTNQGESGANPNLLSPALQALAKLVEEGRVEWHGGKPKGLRGVVVRGEPVSETIIRDRR